MDQSRTWYEVVADCQIKVQRLRAVLTTGAALSSELQADLDSIILAMRNYLLHRARLLENSGEDAVEEALFAIISQLHRDLKSPGYGSMERSFGKYISTLTNRVVFQFRRKRGQPDALSRSVSLDETVGEDGLPRYELIEDTGLEQLAETFNDEQRRQRMHEAISRLSPIDREVITMRLANTPGKVIAEQLGMSQPNVTHIYNRVVQRLSRELGEES